MVLFFVTVFFLGFFTFIALLEGFGIDRLTFGGIKIEKLYLKWENALHIRAAKIDFSALKTDDTPLTLQPLGDLPRIVRWMERWSASIHIDLIKYKNYAASLSYQKNGTGTLTLQHGQMTCKGLFTLNERRFHFAVPACRVQEGTLSAQLMVELPTQQLHADVSVLLPRTPLLHLQLRGSSDTLRFTLHSDGNFTTVAPLVHFFGVNPKITPWITEYAKASSARLHRLEGNFPYAEPHKLVETLVASATVEGGEYTFAQGFQPIKSPRIDLLFKEGKLHILPHEGSFYALPTEKSRLWIDFSSPHTTLTALIQTRRARLNDPILQLLHHYGIDLPLKQISGECDVDLNLAVDLRTLETTAKGTFRPTPSELLLDRIALRSEGGIVHLDTRVVRFENFIAHYGEDIAHARVSGEYDASSDRGKVSIEAYDVSPLAEGNHLSLFDPKKPLRVTYTLAPGEDTLNVSPSSWRIFDEKLEVKGFSAPFDYRNGRVAVQSLPFSIHDDVAGNISAQFDGASEKADLTLELERFAMGGIVLAHAPMTFKVRYADALTTIACQNTSAWSLHKLPLLLSPISATLKEDRITFGQAEAILSDLLKGRIEGNYRLSDQKGSIRVDNLLPINPKISPWIDAKEAVELSIDAQGEAIRLDAPALSAHFTTIPEGWKIAFDDISLLSGKSPLLRRYHINKGHLNLFYTGERSLYRFEGAIDYPYPLMMINDRPLSQYRFSGSYRDGLTTIRVNDRLVINHTPERLFARANNAGINVPELFKFLSVHENSTAGTTNSDSVPVRIHATNTYLQLMKGRKIVADTLDATLNNGDFDAMLNHAGGSAALKIRDGRFSILGGGFNETFMQHLFSLAEMSGGTFGFQAQGDADAFDGLMRVENTVLKEYKILNNVLAFINTVPSLTTFSLPNYHSQGLPVKEGYAHFVYDKGIVHVDNFTLDSPEIKILGEGRANINTQTLEGTMTLKTDLGSTLGKVPMVGYILFGEDGSVATTLTLSGRLDDPKVETAIAKEIATAPFNILKRTVIYPFLWMIPDDGTKK